MKNQPEVKILQSRVSFPAIFATHTWLVTIEDEKITRWEILHKKKNGSHLHLNKYKPYQGLPVFLGIKNLTWKSKVLKEVKGELANKIINRLKQATSEYPHQKYAFSGPNSNTFTQWVINSFSELDIKLPKSSIGKDYPIDNS